MKTRGENWLVFAVLLILIGVGIFYPRPTGNVTFGQMSSPGNDTFSCQLINVSGTYAMSRDILNENVSLSGCFNISVSDVVLDCNGYLIANSSVSQPAVSAQGLKNITVKNCKIQMSDSDSGYGIYFNDINDSFILNNNFSSSHAGIYLKSVRTTGVQMNIFNSNKIGIYAENSSGNTFSRDVITNCTGLDGDGCLSLVDSSDNTFNFEKVETSAGDLISLRDLSLGSNNNLFKDVLLSGASGIDVNLTKISYVSVNNSFINVSYFSNKEFVSSGNELIRKWYYRAYVITSKDSSPVANANISIYNLSNTVVASALTASNGFIVIQEITAYVNNGTQNNFTYRIVATNTSSIVNHSISLTGNYLSDYFTFNTTSPSSSTNSSTSNSSSSSTSVTPAATTVANATRRTNATTTVASGANSVVSEEIAALPLNVVAVVEKSQVEEGYSKTLKEGESIIINLTEETHNIKVEKFISDGNYSVTITVSSDPITFNLSLGETKKLDFNSDSYYDLLVGFNKIVDNNPEIFVLKINQSVNLKLGNPSASLFNKMSAILHIPIYSKIVVWHVVTITAFFAGIVILYFVVKHRKSSVKKNKISWKKK